MSSTSVHQRGGERRNVFKLSWKQCFSPSFRAGGHGLVPERSRQRGSREEGATVCLSALLVSGTVGRSVAVGVRGLGQEKEAEDNARPSPDASSRLVL